MKNTLQITNNKIHQMRKKTKKQEHPMLNSLFTAIWEDFMNTEKSGRQSLKKTDH